MGMAGSSLECFTGATYTLDSSKTEPATDICPAGIIELHNGQVTWKAMVDVTIGDVDLDDRQIDQLHRLAAQEGFHAIITIGNQAPTELGLPPVVLNRRRLRKVPAFHFSWESLFQEAQFLTSVVDGHCEKWVLSEWLSFMDNPDAPITTRYGLGPFWENVEIMAQKGGLRAKDQAVQSVAQAWRDHLQATARRFGARLGTEIAVRATECELSDGDLHTSRIANRLANHGSLSGQLAGDGTIGGLDLSLNPATGEATFVTDLSVPAATNPLQSIRRLAVQLKRIDALEWDGIRIYWDQKSIKTHASVAKVIQEPMSLQRLPGGKNIPPGAKIARAVFERRIQLHGEGEGRSAQFLDDMSGSLDEFCSNVICNLADSEEF